ENITTPITAIIAWITDLSIKILHLSFGKPSNKIMKTELKDFFIDHDDKATLDIYEKQMILNLYEFSDRKAIEIMRPRTEVFTIENSNDIDSVIGKVKETDFSRIPIFEDNFENIIGILYVRDLILVQSNNKTFILSGILKPAYFIPEYKKVDELFIEFIKKHIHFAVVVDEYGGFSGIITLEDILEEIIGEIEDKEEFEIKIEKTDEKTYIVEGRLELGEFNQRFNVNLESKDAETLNGLLLEKFGEIPEEGEVLEINKIKFEMLAVSNNKIDKIRVFFK
ncbi:CBS domain-containing protein, partial [Candidatus Dependentiae bacterium]|nr:CBS domain-containing protein [Candidatus Dependentiae bacterium]